MEIFMLPPTQNNPLSKYFRQAKIFLRLPSKGRHYPPNALEMTESGELPVYSMTAKDELMMKIPDALINGESTVEIIKSCIPNIKDPWKMPSVDTDAVLIAIRIATFGEMLEITSKVPVIGEERTFQVDLRNFLDQLINFQYEPFVQINDDITIQVRPLTYKEFTDNALKTFEEQRIFKLVTDDTIPDDKKLQAFTNSFKKLTNLTIDMIVNSVDCIDTPDGKVNDKKFIREFFNNADKDVFSKLMKHLELLKEKTTIKPLKVKSTPEDIERGVPEEYEIPITFDQSNFFV
jgi:hypothetical protein